MPGLRENIEDRLRRDIAIDEEFAGLIPPLSEDEYSRLEQSILEEGCREAIILWDGVIIDGHNRYSICKAHNIPFRTRSMEFATREEVMLWMMRNQLARRNLNDFQRVEVVRRYEEAVRAKAEERQKVTRFGGGGKITTTVEKSRDTLGALAGVSGKTYEHATAIIDNAPEEVKEAVRSQAVSINAGYETTKLSPEAQAEISRRIREGEEPRKVVGEAVKRPQKYSITPSREDAIKVAGLAVKYGVSVSEMFVRLIHKALEAEEREIRP